MTGRRRAAGPARPGWAALLVAAVGCSGPAEPVVFEPAARYTVTGEASGSRGGFTARCTVDLVFAWNGLVRLETAQVYVTSGGGELERTVQRPDGSGMAFTALVHTPESHVRLSGADSIVLVTPENLETGHPFYRGIGWMRGRITGPHTAEGTWTCGPLDVAEDGAGAVDGTWRLAPA